MIERCSAALKIHSETVAAAIAGGWSVEMHDSHLRLIHPSRDSFIQLSRRHQLFEEPVEQPIDPAVAERDERLRRIGSAKIRAALDRRSLGGTVPHA